MSKLTSAMAKAKAKFDWREYFLPNRKLIAIIPYVVIASMFIIVPMVLLIVKASTPAAGLTQNATTQILKEDSTWDIMGRSIYLGLAAAAISLLLAFPFAYIVSRTKSKTFKVVSITLLVTPLLVFTVAKVFALKIFLMNIFDDPKSIQNQGVMILGMVYLYMPFMIIPLYSVISQMPESLLEASKDLGYSKVKSIFKVVFPFAMKAIFSGVAIVFMLSATSLVISGTLVGSEGKAPNSSLTMIGNLMDSKAINMRQNQLAASQGSLVALVTIAVMMSIYAGIYLIPILFRKLRGGVNV